MSRSGTSRGPVVVMTVEEMAIKIGFLAGLRVWRARTMLVIALVQRAFTSRIAKMPMPEMIMSAGQPLRESGPFTSSTFRTSPVEIVRCVDMVDWGTPRERSIWVSLEGVRATVIGLAVGLVLVRKGDGRAEQSKPALKHSTTQARVQPPVAP